MTENITPAALPDGIRARQVDNHNGLRMQVLEAGFETPGRPGVLLLHGFPELAYSWRRVMPALAAAGYHVFAPDQRGYGGTTGWDGRYEADISPFRMPNLVRDALGLVFALGHRSVAVVGHDFGSPVAAWCALMRPDVFCAVTLMSAPFGGPPPLPFDTARPDAAPAPSTAEAVARVLRELAALLRPRKHYQWYYATPQADADMLHCAQGVHDFLRAYYHHKSADCEGNRPEPLSAWTAAELARMPTYYIMDMASTMAETVAPHMPTRAQIDACAWLSEAELAVYSEAFSRTGFQGGLQWYRCGTSPAFAAELQTWSGRAIDVPSCFIAGRSDWGVYQRPGEFEKMRTSGCTRMLGCHLVPGAGHWVQQEQPQEVSRLLLDFLREAGWAPGAG